jgi:multidrug resistance efflux pump
LADEIAKLQVLPRMHARAILDVAEAELESMQDIKNKNPGAVSDAEMRKFEAQVAVARAGLERAEAKETAESIQATAGKLSDP